MSMILIILHHICQNTYLQYPDDPTITILVSMIGRSGIGKIGVIVFVLITGYFMATQTITLKRVLKLLAEVWFYSFAATLFAIIVLNQQITTGLIQTTLFPIITHRWWFMTGYVFLIILSPFINKGLKQLSAREHFVLCIFLILVTYGLRSIGDSFYLSEYATFIVIYIIAAFIRLHPQEIFMNFRNDVIVLIVSSCSFLLLTALNVFVNYYGSMGWGVISKIAIVAIMAVGLVICLSKKGKMMTDALLVLSLVLLILPHFLYLGYRDYTYLFSLNNTLVGIDLAVSLSLFLVFLNMKPIYNRKINWLTSSILAVYLIHGTVFGSWLHWLNSSSYFFSGFYPFYILGVSIITLFGCIFIDKCRDYLIFRPLSKPFGKVYDRIEEKVIVIWNKLETGFR